MKLYYSIIIVCFVISSCTPAPVFRMTPAAEQTTFDHGSEYITMEKNGITLVVSYYRHLGNRFIMDVEIVNNRDTVIRVDPMDHSYIAYKSMPVDSTSHQNNVIIKWSAIDPEVELLNKDMAISRSVASQKTGTLFYVVGQLASTGQSIIEEDTNKKERLRQERTENTLQYQANQQWHETRRARLRDNRQVWELKTLRKTDLWPDEYIRGFVFFKNQPDAEGYTFRFVVDSTEFTVNYRQTKYRVR